MHFQIEHDINVFLFIYSDLQKKGQTIELNDIFIAAVTLEHGAELATDNVNHYQQVLQLIELLYILFSLIYLDYKIWGIFLKMTPRCENCGKWIHRLRYKLIHSIPAYCPSCGAKISLEQKKNIIDFEIIFCTVVFITFAILMMILVKLGLV